MYLDPPHILDKVDFSTGTATLADFDSEAIADGERTEETTPRAWFTAFKETVDGKEVTKYNSEGRDCLAVT